MFGAIILFDVSAFITCIEVSTTIICEVSLIIMCDVSAIIILDVSAAGVCVCCCSAF